MIGNIIGAGISAAGSLAGAYLQAKSQQKINQRNLEYQQEANRLSVDLANSAHQREVDDLRAAGLNPILSAGGSGAQTPSIGAVTAENPYNGLSHSAQAVSREIGRLFTDQVALNNEQTAAQTDNIRAQLVQIESDAELKKAMADSIRSGRNVFDLGKETITPAAESFGEWLGNSAFKAKQWMSNEFNRLRGVSDPPKRIMYKDGRYHSLFDLWEKDRDYVEQYLRRQK